MCAKGTGERTVWLWLLLIFYHPTEKPMTEKPTYIIYTLPVGHSVRKYETLRGGVWRCKEMQSYGIMYDIYISLCREIVQECYMYNILKDGNNPNNNNTNKKKKKKNP